MKSSRPLLVVIVLFLLAATTLPAAAAGASGGVSIQNVTYGGDGVIDSKTGRVWQQGDVNIRVHVHNGNESGQHTVCAAVEGARTCTQAYIETGQTQTVGVNAGPFQNTTGDQNITVTVAKGINTEGSPIASAESTMSVYNRTDDFDGDGLRNDEEVKRGTDIEVRDSDEDGLEDGPEVNNHGTNPLNPDTDGDGLRDSEEVSQGTGATNPDSDGDGLSDGSESENSSKPLKADTDDDGLDDGREAEFGSDPANTDSDDDGLTDSEEVEKHGTDPTKSDTDSDGLSDDEEVVADTNANDRDTDDDGLNDGREDELGTSPNSEDTDGDGLDDGLEVRVGTNPQSAVSALFVGVLVLLALMGLAHLLVRRGVGHIENHDAIPERLRPAVRRGRQGVERASNWVVERTFPESGEGHRPENGHDAGRTIEAPPSVEVPADDSPVLSDEEKTIELLREHGGRLPQREITEQSEWSKSKVSRLLSKMEDQGLITKINLGRENLIALNDDVPDGVKSPLDE